MREGRYRGSDLAVTVFPEGRCSRDLGGLAVECRKASEWNQHLLPAATDVIGLSSHDQYNPSA